MLIYKADRAGGGVFALKEVHASIIKNMILVFLSGISRFMFHGWYFLLGREEVSHS